MSHFVLVSVAFATPALFLSSCKPGIVAKCTPQADITSVDFGPSRVGTTSIGILNTHHFSPGDVIELIPLQRGQAMGTGSRIDTLNFAPADFLADDPPATTSQVVATDFQLTLDAKLQAFSSQIQAALKSNTKLTLTEGSRHALAHPLDVLGATANRTVRDHILQFPTRSYIVITGVVNGKGVDIQYQQDNSGSVNVNVLKVPGTNITATVTYNCSNVANIASVGQTKAGLAFFYTTVAAQNGEVATVATADLTKYSIPNALL